MKGSLEHVLWIVEGRASQRNAAEQQLGKSLRQAFCVRCVSLAELRFFGQLLTGTFTRYRHVITSVRPDALLAAAPLVGPFLQGKTLWVFDPRPWETLQVGLYESLCHAFVRYDDCFCAFVVPSDKWALLVSMRGMAAVTAKVDEEGSCVVALGEERVLRSLKTATNRTPPYLRQSPESLEDALRRSSY